MIITTHYLGDAYWLVAADGNKRKAGPGMCNSQPGTSVGYSTEFSHAPSWSV